MTRFAGIKLLTAAVGVLVTGCSHPPPTPAANQAHREARERNLSDIHFDADLTQEQVVAIWGQPDGYRGSGVAYVEYTLENGQEVWMQFLPEPTHVLNGALLFPAGGGKSRLLFSR